MGGKPGKMLLWFLRLEHLVQANAKAVFEGTPAETRRQGDSNKCWCLARKMDRKHLIIITVLPQNVYRQRSNEVRTSAASDPFPFHLWHRAEEGEADSG